MNLNTGKYQLMINKMDKIEKLRNILSKQIKWYIEKKEQEENRNIDESYIYDELIQEFSALSRGDYLDIIEILVEDKKQCE